MPKRSLTREEFLATFAAPMRRLETEGLPPVGFWPYVDGLSEEEVDGLDISEGSVEYVYRDALDRFEHVLIDSTTKNVYLVVVLDLKEETVLGHRRLDLNAEYGLPTECGPR